MSKLHKKNKFDIYYFETHETMDYMSILSLNCVVANIDANKTKTISRTVHNRITGIEFTKKYKLINKNQNK
jgi:hypothetical protein